MTAEFDADLTHPWATRWRIPRVSTTHPKWLYEVALVVPTAGGLYEGALLEPTEAEAQIIGCYIDYRRSYYHQGWQEEMLRRPFDVDDSTNSVVLALCPSGWMYRRYSFRHGLWPFPNDPRRAEFPPTAKGLVALLDHINDLTCRRWADWKTAHPEIEQALAEGTPC